MRDGAVPEGVYDGASGMRRSFVCRLVEDSWRVWVRERETRRWERPRRTWWVLGGMIVRFVGRWGDGS